MTKASGASPFAAGAVIARRYRLLRLLGEGSMSVVWHARDTETDADVALKLFVRPDQALRVRLLREARATIGLRHTNVASALDVGETGSGDPFVVMELLTGETLADVLAREGLLDPMRAAAICRDVARGLAAAHEQGLVHRDLRPSHVLLHQPRAGGAPVVKILDLGLTRNLVAPGDADSRSYTSPELFLGVPAIDGRTDIWSLGAMLFELLSGVKPFEGASEEVVSRIAAGNAPLLWHKVRNIHPGLSGLVMACLRRDRDERPWPASDIARRLDHFATPSATPSWAPPGRSTRPPSASARPPSASARPPSTSARPPSASAHPPARPSLSEKASKTPVSPVSRQSLPAREPAPSPPVTRPMRQALSTGESKVPFASPSRQALSAGESKVPFASPAGQALSPSPARSPVRPAAVAAKALSPRSGRSRRTVASGASAGGRAEASSGPISGVGRRPALILPPKPTPSSLRSPSDADDVSERTTLPSAAPLPVPARAPATSSPSPWSDAPRSRRVPTSRRTLMNAALAAAALLTVLALAAAVYAAIFGEMPPKTRNPQRPIPAAPGPAVPAGLDAPHY